MGSLEPHADFNQLMTSPAQDIQSIFSTWGGGATFYPGDQLNFALENGTQVDSQWLAVYNYPQSTGPLETGGDFYNFFVLGVSLLSPLSLATSPLLISLQFLFTSGHHLMVLDLSYSVDFRAPENANCKVF